MGERAESLIMEIVFSLWRQRQHHPVVCVRGKSISSLSLFPLLPPFCLSSFPFLPAFDKLQIVFLVNLNAATTRANECEHVSLMDRNLVGQDIREERKRELEPGKLNGILSHEDV